MRENLYWMLAVVFVPLSLTAIGGGISVLPAIQHQAVDVQHWTTGSEFVDLFAISRAAPGPGTMLVTLVGWKVGGWSGALVATLAIFLPSSILCLVATRTWAKLEDRKWYRIIQAGLAPIGTGLIAAGAMALFRIADGGPAGAVAAAATGVLLLLKPRTAPLLPILLTGALFAVAGLS